MITNYNPMWGSREKCEALVKAIEDFEEKKQHLKVNINNKENINNEK